MEKQKTKHHKTKDKLARRVVANLKLLKEEKKRCKKGMRKWDGKLQNSASWDFIFPQHIKTLCNPIKLSSKSFLSGFQSVNNDFQALEALFHFINQTFFPPSYQMPKNLY